VKTKWQFFVTKIIDIQDIDLLELSENVTVTQTQCNNTNTIKNNNHHYHQQNCCLYSQVQKYNANCLRGNDFNLTITAKQTDKKYTIRVLGEHESHHSIAKLLQYNTIQYNTIQYLVTCHM